MNIVGGRQEQVRIDFDGNLVATPESNEKISILLGINRVNIYLGKDGWIIESNQNIEVKTISISKNRSLIQPNETCENIHEVIQRERFE